MWFKITIILFIITLLAVAWYKTFSANVAYFYGSTKIQIPSPLFTKGQKDNLSVAINFPKSGARNGVVLFMKGSGANNFQIVYIQDGKLIINTNNNKDQSLIMVPDLEDNVKKQSWLRVEFIINDQFENVPIYFGGAPIEQIPVNTLMFDGQSSVIQFPRSGLVARTNYMYLNDINLGNIFQNQ